MASYRRRAEEGCGYAKATETRMDARGSCPGKLRGNQGDPEFGDKALHGKGVWNFDTDRSQPMRVCAGTSVYSSRIEGIWNGMLMAVIPASNTTLPCAPTANMEAMVGAADR